MTTLAVVYRRPFLSAAHSDPSKWSVAAITCLLFACVSVYPFEDARLALGSLIVPYATLVLIALAVCLILQAFLDSRDVTASPLTVAGTWLLVSSVVFSSLFTHNSGRLTQLDALAETFVFVMVPLLLAMALRRPADITLSFGAFYASLLFLTGFGLFRYITERREWVEFHYEEATRNGDAVYLTAAFCASFALLVHSVRSHRHVATTSIALAVTVVCGFAVIMSLSRSAWIAAAVGAAVAYRRWRGKRSPGARTATARPLLLILVVVALGVVFWTSDNSSEVLQPVTTRARSLVDNAIPGNSNLERIDLLHSTLAALPRWGWTGAGPGNFRFAIDAPTVRLQHAHNAFLNLWVELGIVGLIGFALLLWEFRQSVVLGASRVPAVTRSVAAIGAAWFVHALFETPTSSLFFWALLGLGLALPRVREPCERTMECP